MLSMPWHCVNHDPTHVCRNGDNLQCDRVYVYLCVHTYEYTCVCVHMCVYRIFSYTCGYDSMHECVCACACLANLVFTSTAKWSGVIPSAVLPLGSHICCANNWTICRCFSTINWSGNFFLTRSCSRVSFTCWFFTKRLGTSAAPKLNYNEVR